MTPNIQRMWFFIGLGWRQLRLPSALDFDSGMEERGQCSGRVALSTMEVI
jgi:hypothetical protein